MKGRGEDRMAAWLKERLPRAELDATIRLKYVPNRAATTNQSPDFLVELEVRLPLFPETPLVVRVPWYFDGDQTGPESTSFLRWIRLQATDFRLLEEQETHQPLVRSCTT